MPESKCKLHSTKNCFGKIDDQASIKDGLGEKLCNRSDVVNQYQKYENKWRMELKYLKRKNRMIFNMDFHSSSRR